ncbi:hypothetical protein [Ideonella sp. YS5]|uniref:hypothetical protein n=1 Tax=Ideonella sp. YS5 TaxID=3453714 RepID=UPI003EEFDF57
MFDFVATSAPHIRSGGIAPLAVTSSKRLSDELAEVMNSAEVKAGLETAASFPINMPHEAFQDFVAREAGQWAEVIRKSGAKLD